MLRKWAIVPSRMKRPYTVLSRFITWVATTPFSVFKPVWAVLFFIQRKIGKEKVTLISHQQGETVYWQGTTYVVFSMYSSTDLEGHTTTYLRLGLLSDPSIEAVADARDVTILPPERPPLSKRIQLRIRAITDRFAAVKPPRASDEPPRDE